jgi:microcystin degradation protein MlrC
MKIVVGSLQQESNTLTSRMSRREDFAVFRGADMLPPIAVTDLFASSRVDIIPTLYAHALPGGRLREADFLDMAGELVALMPRTGIDGVWLYLHGSLEVENLGSGELALLRMVRAKIGSSVPIALALDFHANNTPELMDLVNIVVGYRTAPHRDMRETELRAARLLVHSIEHHLLPRPQMARAYVVVPGDCVLTDELPLRQIMAEAALLEQTPGMLACNVFNGHPWADVPHMGPSMVCIHEKDERAAKDAALRLAQRFFEARHDFKFSVDACEPAEALDRAWSVKERPVFVTDSGDNTTAGASGDNAFLLKLVMEKGMTNVLLGGIADEPAIHACHAVEPGSRIELDLGGSLEPASTRAHVHGAVLFKGDIEGWYGENAGPCVVLRCDGIDIIVTARRTALIRPGIFEKLGIRLNDYRFIIVKLGYLYPDLARIAQRAFLAFTKGGSTERLQDMEMKRIHRPMFPLDDDFEKGYE